MSLMEESRWFVMEYGMLVTDDYLSYLVVLLLLSHALNLIGVDAVVAVVAVIVVVHHQYSVSHPISFVSSKTQSCKNN